MLNTFCEHPDTGPLAMAQQIIEEMKKTEERKKEIKQEELVYAMQKATEKIQRRARALGQKKYQPVQFHVPVDLFPDFRVPGFINPPGGFGNHNANQAFHFPAPGFTSGVQGAFPGTYQQQDGNYSGLNTSTPLQKLADQMSAVNLSSQQQPERQPEYTRPSQQPTPQQSSQNDLSQNDFSKKINLPPIIPEDLSASSDSSAHNVNDTNTNKSKESPKRTAKASLPLKGSNGYKGGGFAEFSEQVMKQQEDLKEKAENLKEKAEKAKGIVDSEQKLEHRHEKSLEQKLQENLQEHLQKNLQKSEGTSSHRDLETEQSHKNPQQNSHGAVQQNVPNSNSQAQNPPVNTAPPPTGTAPPPTAPHTSHIPTEEDLSAASPNSFWAVGAPSRVRIFAHMQGSIEAAQGAEVIIPYPQKMGLYLSDSDALVEGQLVNYAKVK
jgi:hypothetical protein